MAKRFQVSILVDDEFTGDTLHELLCRAVYEGIDLDEVGTYTDKVYDIEVDGGMEEVDPEGPTEEQQAAIERAVDQLDHGKKVN